MSHYIQDNQCVIKTEDGALMLFLKGGDNNVSSASTNRRCTSWFFNKTFKNEQSFMNYILDALLSDIRGGSWQFKSLQNKSFNGVTGYESAVIRRFKKAIKQALSLDMSIMDITMENIPLYEHKIESLMLSKGFSLNNEDGIQENISLYSRTYEKDKEAIIKKCLPVEYKAKSENEGYFEFCEQYKNTPKEDALMDIDYCRSLSKYSDRWSLYGLIPHKYLDIPNENFSALFKDNAPILLNSWGTELLELFIYYPEQMKYILENTSLMDSMHSIYEKTISNEDENWRSKSMKENIEIFEKFLSKNYPTYIATKTKAIQDARDSAPKEFVELWNGLCKDAYYKTTSTRLPSRIKKAKELLQVGSFTLKDVQQKCNSDFRKLTYYYENQYKKNQKAIANAAKDLLDEFSLLLDKETKNILTEYFKLQPSLI